MVYKRFLGNIKKVAILDYERRVPKLIPVLGSQPAGDVSHKRGGRLPLLSAKNRDQLRHPTLGNRVWVSFIFLVSIRVRGWG